MTSRLTYAPVGLAVAVLAALTGCSARRVPEPLSADACEVVPRPPGKTDSLTVALPGLADPANVPVPGNDAERLIFGQLYETLVASDCAGRLTPGLAESWRIEAGGRIWRFKLRRDARFADGRPLRASDAVAALQQRREIAVGTVAIPVFDSLEAVDERTLAVHLAFPWQGPATRFADPTLAIADTQAAAAWRLGTRGYRVTAARETTGSNLGRLITLEPASSSAGPVLRFQLLAGADPRDALEAGADLLVTGEREVLQYVATRRQFLTAPLGWGRTYVLIAPGRVRELRRGGLEPESGGASLGPDLRAELARDAVPVEARGHASTAWWEDLSRCAPYLESLRRTLPPIAPGAYQTSGVRRLVFAEDDPVARGLAERIVALAADPGYQAAPLSSALPGLGATDGPLLATGLEDAAFASRMSEGSDFAYVFSLPFRVYDPCRAALSLIRQAEWLSVQELDLSSTLVPLVDTRQHVVVRRASVGVSLEWDGTPKLFGSARSR